MPDLTPWNPTYDDAMSYTHDFLEAARLLAEAEDAGPETANRERIVDLLVGPETGDDEAMKRLVAMFCTGALVAGHLARDTMAPGAAGALSYVAYDAVTGEPVTPDDAPPEIRHAIGALVAGGNADTGGVVAHLSAILDYRNPEPVMDATWMFLRVASEAGKAATP